MGLIYLFCFFHIHFNIIIPPRLDLPSALFLSGFPNDTLYEPLLSGIRTTFSAYLILLDSLTLIIFGKK